MLELTVNFSDAIMREFSTLLSHIDSSFDNFRAELSALIFPIFAHLYIQLIAEGRTLQGLQRLTFISQLFFYLFLDLLHLLFLS